MAEIISLNKIKGFAAGLRSTNKKIVLVGGCFDVLHPGHVIFLEKAKKAGDILVVILESDKRIRELKGVKRPAQNQRDRAKMLSAFGCVDYIVLLPYIKSDLEYDALVEKIKPDVIAVTRGEENINHHQRAAKLVGAKLKFVTKMVGDHSSSRILNH